MTSQQKSILLILALANILLLCIAPAAYLLLARPADQDALQSAFALFTSSSLQITATNSPPQPTPTLEAGWKLYRVPDDGFAVALPPTWKQIPVDQSDVATDIDTLARRNPELGSAAGTQSSIAALIKFIGIDTAPEGNVGSFTTVVNIFHRTQPFEAPLDVYIPITLKALQDLPYGSKPVLHRRVQTLAGEAEEFQFHNTLKLPNDQNVTTANRQYILVHAREFYLITCTAPLKQEDRYALTFEKIAKSFRWIGD